MSKSAQKSQADAAPPQTLRPAPKKRAGQRPSKRAKTGGAKAKASPETPAAAPGKAVRRLPRKTFLIAATMPDGGTKPDLRVYASVTRTPAEALAAVRAELGEGVSVELTGKLSNRMAKTLGLKADEVRQI